jgi:signal transduction histidine kinase
MDSGDKAVDSTQPAAQVRPAGILVVDDTPANLRLLTGMLKEHGYRVRPVPSGRLAMQAVQNELPDLILLDITMPEMSGYEVCEQLKAEPASRDIPVLFISALDETIDKIKAFAVGGLDYITKPFQFEEVEARVQTHLRLRQLQVELEQRNRQVQASYDQLRELETLRDNLTSMVVHDMRSPLMGIMGYLEILEMDAGPKLNPTELAVLSEAREVAQVLAGMVNSLLDVSRLEQGQMPLHLAPADLDALIAAGLGSLGALPQQVSLRHLQHSPALRVTCDADLVTRVVANLVGNAIKFTPEGGQVTVAAESCEQGVKIRVVDTGGGIPREYHQRIFEKFGQVEARQQRTMYSTGLGLTFCKLAVEAQGGRIGVESEVGKGSTFWFTLPG